MMTQTHPRQEPEPCTARAGYAAPRSFPEEGAQEVGCGLNGGSARAASATAVTLWRAGEGRERPGAGAWRVGGALLRVVPLPGVYL